MNVSEPLPPAITPWGSALARLQNSAVVWSWIYNGFRLAAGLLLLPLVLTKLPSSELGMYYVLLNLAAIVPLIDFGFGPTIGRFVTYAMGGADTIQAHGVAAPGSSAAPNYRLLWELLHTTRTLYRFLTIALFVVLGAWGTYEVESLVHETASPTLTRLAWGFTLVSSLLDIYSNWWVMYVRSMNQVLAATRIALLSTIVRLVLAGVLLLCGGGLLSLPLGTLCGSSLQRYLARRLCRRLLADHPAPAELNVKKILRILWPNTWRLGVQFFSGYLTVNANTAICSQVLGLSGTAQYGLSVQLLAFISGMAGVWTAVKWPLIGQFLARHDLFAVQRAFRPRVWLQYLTYLAACAGLLFLGPFLLSRVGAHKQMLPTGWLALMMLNGFLETQFIAWGTLLSTSNRLNYLWPTVTTNVLSLVFSLVLIHVTSLGLGALVLGPLLAGCLFNYWYWPPYAARTLGVSYFRLMLLGPQTPKTQPGNSQTPA